ncbi:TPA: AAA domain-containing protein [Citrobacter pasteurii]
MDSTPRPQEILRTWQRIEFFQPYTLERKDKSLLIPLKKLITLGNASLPWHSEKLRQQYDIPLKASFIVHVGLFEKSIVSNLSEEVLGPNEDNDDECEQRLDQEGTTCFAKMQLNGEGVPARDKLSVSSLPWALGHLKKRQFHKLDSSVFAVDCRHLSDTFNDFCVTLEPVREKGPGVLRASDILTLLDTHLTSWADFAPEWQYAVQIDWFNGNSESQDTEQEETSETEDLISDNEKALVLPILNSFFFEDIEDAMSSLEDTRCRTLNTYLTHRVHRNPDLYSQEGLTAIIDKLHPTKMPLGRWPSEPEHAMSLMQQFAINTAVEELAEGGLLSVNGPPGTGKTTLLRDLIAHNVVERARVLAGFSNVEDTLTHEGFILPELTGFEMIVASSNNAAVENISHELPQKKSLAEEFRSLDYLSPTANQVAAKSLPKSAHKRDKDGKGTERNYHLFRPLETEKQCWGLISSALGRKVNRTKFAQRLLFDEHFLRDTSVEMARPDNENFLSLWRWKSCHNKLSFTAAKLHFIHCLKTTEELQKQLAEFAELLAKKPDCSSDVLSSDMAKAAVRCEERLSALKELEAERDVIEKQVQHARQQQKIEEADAPGLLTRLLNRKKVQTYQTSLRNTQQHLLTLSASLIQKTQHVAELRKQLNEADAQKRRLQQEIDRIAQQHEEIEQKLQGLKDKFSGIALPDSHKSIDNAGLQRTAFWQNAQINRQRSLLFMAAMDLHQAWLYEAMGSVDRFREMFLLRLRNFLNSPHLESTPLPWWQTLCMFVPVLSTTFASVGRMLHGVKGGELGWVMIDEAGQASPQQAVGAIWRARRVLVVGDPLQIEPVFTTSPSLVRHLCQDLLHEHAEKWNPEKLSVQQVADRVNHWGCKLEMMNNNIWIGIPLWVHRRCIEPMFSIANKLAYNNRMIHGLDTDKICSRLVNGELENHWLVSRGGLGDKQYRDSHGQSLITLLDRLLVENIELGSIYVITPFKAVKYALLELIEQRELASWQQYSPRLKHKEIKEWQKSCVGTVHTFQGKENDIVIFVLGCDVHNRGGAEWASSKPNLLNVALTRAKKHIFVIGDPLVWKTLPGFESVAHTLPEKAETNIIVEQVSLEWQ